jgi:putative inorganic carbon (HCO3(-)) transporter
MKKIFFPSIFIFSFLAALMPVAAYDAHCFMAAIILLAGALAFCVYKQDANPKTISVMLIGAIWFLAFLSVLFSEIPTISFVYFCFFSAMPMAFFVARLVPDPQAFFKNIFIGLWFIFVALGIFCIAQHFYMPGWLYKGLVYWPFADPNALAGMFLFGIFGGLGLMMGAQTRLYSNAGLILAILGTGVIFLTGSRGAILALLITLPIFIALARAHFKKHWRCGGVWAAVNIILFFAFSASSSFFVKSPLLTMIAGSDAVSPRMALWGSAFRIFMDHFWTGTGIGTFFLYYPAYRGADTNTAGFMAHNDILQFTAEMGFAAPLLIYGLIIAVIFLTLQRLKSLPQQTPDRVYIAAAFCTLGAITIHAHINFPWNVLPTLILTGLTLGYWDYLCSTKDRSFAAPRVTRHFRITIITLMTMIFTCLQTGDILVNRAKKSLESGNLESFVRDINFAEKITAGRNARAQILAASIPLSILEADKNIAPAEKEKFYARAEFLLRRAYAINPRGPEYFYMMARLSKIMNKDPVNDLRMALALDPLHSASRIMLADALIKQNKSKEALELLKDGMKWPNNDSAYFQKTAFLALELNDIETHRIAINRAMRPAARDYIFRREWNAIYGTKTP